MIAMMMMKKKMMMMMKLEILAFIHFRHSLWKNGEKISNYDRNPAPIALENLCDGKPQHNPTEPLITPT
jgi:hypothetical protein